MTTILIKDKLRQTIEAASGGARTVLYTAKGQPTFMNIIEKFNVQDISTTLGTGVHPAFIINGSTVDRIFVGTYQGVIRNGELLSLPNETPTVNNTFDAFLTAARACGTRHHLVTNAEWAALALQSYKNGTMPQGNTYYGRSAEDATQAGRRVDGRASGAVIPDPIPSGEVHDPRIYTGSGPVSFNHNGKYNGICDLAGNVSEFVAGIRFVNGELQILEHNDSAASLANMASDSTAWKAVDARNGTLITPNGSGTTPYSVKYSTTTADYTVKMAGAQTAFHSLTNPSENAITGALTRLRLLGLYPLVNDPVFGGDTFGASFTDERLFRRGGDYRGGANGGIFHVSCEFTARNAQNATYGARPAYYGSIT